MSINSSRLKKLATDRLVCRGYLYDSSKKRVTILQNYKFLEEQAQLYCFWTITEELLMKDFFKDNKYFALYLAGSLISVFSLFRAGNLIFGLLVLLSATFTI